MWMGWSELRLWEANSSTEFPSDGHLSPRSPGISMYQHLEESKPWFVGWSCFAKASNDIHYLLYIHIHYSLILLLFLKYYMYIYNAYIAVTGNQQVSFPNLVARYLPGQRQVSRFRIWSYVMSSMASADAHPFAPGPSTTAASPFSWSSFWRSRSVTLSPAWKGRLKHWTVAEKLRWWLNVLSGVSICVSFFRLWACPNPLKCIIYHLLEGFKWSGLKVNFPLLSLLLLKCGITNSWVMLLASLDFNGNAPARCQTVQTMPAVMTPALHKSPAPEKWLLNQPLHPEFDCC